MIGSVKGKIILKTDKFLLVEVNGVGYKVCASKDTISKSKEGAEVFLWTHTHVREDALDLYGFKEHEELEFFEMLIQVSGIGPKGALAVLAVASIEILQKAIITGDTAYLTKISGIGRKTAEKIVLDLRDKITSTSHEETGGSLQGELDSLEALKSLGYREHEAREALKKVSSEENINIRIREALKILGGK